MSIQAKDARIETEINTLSTKNPRLYDLIHVLERFVALEFNKAVIVTSIFRTDAEHKELYKDTPNPPATSPHCTWGAVDLRSSIYTDTEIQKMLKFLNCFTYGGGQKPVALYHVIAGNSLHFHIQYR